MSSRTQRRNCGNLFKCIARRGARLADEERGAAKRRGRGLGQRNRNIGNNILDNYN